LLIFIAEIISMDETGPEKMAVLKSDAEMYGRRNRNRLDLVSKLTTAKPTYLQRARRFASQKLSESIETKSTYSSNSLTTSPKSNAQKQHQDQKTTQFHKIMQD
jgi:hypothetical protein